MKAVLFYSDFSPSCKDYYHLFDENNISYECHKDISDEADILQKCKNADAIVVTNQQRFTGAIIEKLDDTVKIIVRVAMGFDTIDVEAASKRGIYVCNIPDYAMEEVAVHQTALMLNCLRKVNLYDKRLREGCWNKVGYLYGYPSRRISVMKVGLLGFGRIAKNVAKYMQAYGATVYAYDPFLPAEVFESLGVIQAKEPDEIFAECDIISPNIPLMESSYHIINRESIAKMKDGVIIVNTGRGPLVDEEALLEGLKSGKVRAAGLDVFEHEPFCDLDHPLMGLENVILTPHIAYQTEESYQELQRKGVEFAIAGIKGEIPYSVVNKNCRG